MHYRHLTLIIALMFSVINVSAQIYDDNEMTIPYKPFEEKVRFDGKVLRGTHKILDKASIRLIKSSSGKWTPATQSGKPIKQFCTYPVIWELPKRE